MKRERSLVLSKRPGRGARKSKGPAPEERVALAMRLDVISQYCPHKPTPKQGAFLLFNGEEGLYGGAGGGGKSDVGLMDCLKYVDVDGYGALIVRRTLHALRQPGALLERSHRWLAGTKAHWDGTSGMFRFPGSGSTGAGGSLLAFGGLEDRKAFDRYASAEFQKIYLEELTQFLKPEYEQFKSRLRRLSTGPLADVPVGIRGGANPGGVGHAWVKGHFVTQPNTDDRMFLFATIADNPHLDRAMYEKTLSGLPPKVRESILKGNWDLAVGAGMYRREWFKLEGSRPDASRIAIAVRYWDTAATEDTGTNDPDATSGLLLVYLTDGSYWICDCRRLMATAGKVRDVAMGCTEDDLLWIPKAKYCVAKEQEPGGDSKGVADEWKKMFLKIGVRFVSDKKVANKIDRASLFATACEGGIVHILEREWTEDTLDEVTNFPEGRYKDRADSMSGAYVVMTKPGASAALDYMRELVKETEKQGAQPGYGTAGLAGL